MPANQGQPGKRAYASKEALTREIIFAIRRMLQAKELYNKELKKKYQVSSSQLNCILALYEQGPLSPSQIAGHIMVNSSTVTGIIDRLENKGLVERKRISYDRRVITVELTKTGKHLAENAPPPIQQRVLDGLKSMSRQDIEQIVRSLQRLTNMLSIQDMDVK
jgi:DNA-binding MarR family transcriptional regulator